MKKLLNWSEQPHKPHARSITIIDQYRKVFGQDLPLNQLYVAMCGDNCTLDGLRSDNVEISQLINSGLITEQQFVGIDNNHQIITRNKQAYPNALWIPGDYVRTILSDLNLLQNGGMFNTDTTSEPPRAVQMTADIMFSLNKLNRTNVLIIVNMVVKNPYNPSRTYDNDSIMTLFNKDPFIQQCIDNGWIIIDGEHGSLEYQNKNTSMRTFWCYKKSPVDLLTLL